MTTVAEALRRGGDRLANTESDAPRLQARLLLSRVLNQSAVWLYQNPNAAIAGGDADRFDGLIDRRLAGHPLHYLIGHVDFFGRSFAVDGRVLVPRPETEEMLEYALRYAATRRSGHDPVRVALDVGTGSGILAITLAAALPGTRVVGIDCSADALEVASTNADRHAEAGRPSFVQSDLLSAIDVEADLIVANLPYVPHDDIPRLSAEVQREPRLALDGGTDGLDVYRRFFAQCAGHLAAPGLLIAEIGAEQGEAALALATNAIPDAAAHVRTDASGRNRFVVAERSG